MNEWSAVIPVRGWASGKSRLGIPGIARAMVLDTLGALIACPDIAEIIVVTGDDAVRADLASDRISVLAEPPDASLNVAIAEAARHRRHPRCVVVLGDLPCLRPDDVALALSRCGSSPSFIADAHGTGSTLWCTHSGPVVTYFGERSRACHRHAGVVELTPRLGDDPAAWARLHRDVDDGVDLADAARLGVGPATLSALASRDIERTKRGPGHRPSPSPRA